MLSMSSITDMVIFAGAMDDEAMARLNAWCAERDTERGQQFRKLDVDAAGGVKVFTSDVWAMAGNYFPYEDLVEALPTFGWMYPEDIVLLVDDDNGDGTEIHRVKEPERRTGWDRLS